LSGLFSHYCLVPIVIQSKSYPQEPKDKQQTMNQRILIKNTTIVNEGKSFIADVLIADVIQIGTLNLDPTYKVIDGTGKHLLPGIIDGQVHFRDPLTHKGDLYTESKAVAGSNFFY
jgi:dihydroorotase-like cyclic amidohydrolase